MTQALPRVLLIGDLSPGSNSRSVADAMREIGCDVRAVDISRTTRPPIGGREWRARHTSNSVSVAENRRLRQSISQAVTAWRPSLVLAIKTVLYDQTSILEVPAAAHVHLSFDDVSNKDNVTEEYLTHESAWDLIVTTKKHNLIELMSRGAKEVLFQLAAFDPAVHVRSTPTEHRDLTLGFIGAARDDRADLPRKLRHWLPGQAAVYGPRWDRMYPFGLKGVEIHRGVFGPSYSLAANRMQAGLILLNSENRDTHTNRTFEVPATGQLVVAQRTEEHEELFSDSHDAILFDDLNEGMARLVDLSGDFAQIGTMAERGYQRVLTGRHTYGDRARELVDVALG